MRRSIVVYGLIAGAIIATSVQLSLTLDSGTEHLAGLEWLGYAVMIIAFSLIFVAIKSYRDRQPDGAISFATGVKLGLGITLIASVIYVIAWEINLALTDYAFIDEYTRAYIAAEEAAGVTGAELDTLKAEMALMRERYDSPLFRVPVTLLEIFPVGLLMSLVSAAVLRDSRVLPAAR
ncbi:MAG: DUF4199 domain-containing protein [Pseudomonadota bacterium]